MPKINELMLDKVYNLLKNKKETFVGPLQTKRLLDFQKKYPGGVHYYMNPIDDNNKSASGIAEYGWMIGVGKTPKGLVSIPAPTSPYIRYNEQRPLRTRMERRSFELPFWDDARRSRYSYELEKEPRTSEIDYDRWPRFVTETYYNPSKEELLEQLSRRGLPIVDRATTNNLYLGGEMRRIDDMKKAGKVPTEYDLKFWDELLED